MANAHKHEKKPDHSKEEAEQPVTADSATQPEEKTQKAEPAMMTISENDFLKFKEELSEYKDKYLRLLAETENMRKRMQKERQELIQYAVQNIIIDFLNPIDQMEKALGFAQQGSDELKHWALGFQMILNQFKEVLTNSGVTAMESKGAKFDPHLHEAVEMVETEDHPAGFVVEESARGYKMGDKTIRPARVKVAKGIKENTEQNSKEK